MAKTGLPPSPKMHHRILFYMKWRVVAYNGPFVANGHLIFFRQLFSLLIGNIYCCPLCFLLFNFGPHSFNFLFIYFSFIEVFSFQFSHSITIFHMFFFLNFSPHSFNFLFCFYSFHRSFFGFQFHPSIKFFVVFFLV